MKSKKTTTSNKETGLKENVISFRLTNSELIELERNMTNVDMTNRANYIKSIIFNKTISVVKVDSTTQNFLIRLNNLQAEYKAIGNNYNQVTKAINATCSDKKALAFLYKLQDLTKELIQVNMEIIELTKDFKDGCENNTRK